MKRMPAESSNLLLQSCLDAVLLCRSISPVAVRNLTAALKLNKWSRQVLPPAQCLRAPDLEKDTTPSKGLIRPHRGIYQAL